MVRLLQAGLPSVATRQPPVSRRHRTAAARSRTIGPAARGVSTRTADADAESFMIRAMASNANEPADKTAPAHDDALNAARAEYTIDELARVGGNTVRNDHAYQDSGLGRKSTRQNTMQ